MQLHTVSIFYRRQHQPAQYEAEEVRLEGSATVEDGENFEAVAYDLITRARVQAHRALGIKVPAIGPFHPAIGPDDAGVATMEPTAEEKPKRTRRTKAQMEADAKAAAETPTPAAAADTTAAAAVTEGDDIVIGGEQAKPAQAEPEFVIEDEPKEIDDKTLQAKAAASARKIGANGSTVVKDLMKEFKVARLGELAQDQRADFVAKLEKLAA